MYGNSSNQYPNSGYQSAYPHYQQAYGGGYNYPGYGQYSTIPGQPPQPTPPGEGSFSSATEWNSTHYGSTQKDAVAQEMQQQKAQLTKQREDYVRKATVLRHELDQLRIQKQELVGNGRASPDRELVNIMKQNDKLQEEIQGKMKAIHNVIEMLSSIIKDGQSIGDLEASLLAADAPKQFTPLSHPTPPDPSSSTSPKKPSSSSTNTNTTSSEKFCYIHYDAGLHWCRSCDEFPDTAKDFLLHLQDKKHSDRSKESDVDSTPWHKLPAEQLLQSYENAPKKRVPIKGLQFFVSAPSWYCKLCDVWIGDLHCASHHLKSQAHFQNYENFIVQNPHWETEWLKDREKAMSRKVAQDTSDDDDSDSPKKKRKKRNINKDKRNNNSSNDQESAKKKKKKSKKKRKKKQKSSDDSSSSSSSSSSSDDDTTSDEDNEEDRSKSIRVAMRNMKQVQSIMEEDLSAKWSVLERLVDEHKKKELREKNQQREELAAPQPNAESEDPLINQWMTVVSQPQTKEKQLLDELKDRMRQKQEVERAKMAEVEQRRREKEREEVERLERKRREEKEADEMEERARIRREQEEVDRIRDKDRSHVRFRTNYRGRRGRRSASKSDDEVEEDEQQEKYYRQDDRHRKDSENRSYKSLSSRSRSRSIDRGGNSGNDRKDDNQKTQKKPPAPPSYKKLPFIGRMPLFKNKLKAPEDREDTKEIKKQSYDQPRKTRFEPGTLPRAFIPKPDVVCFPKLSSIPPLTIPPPPPPTIALQKVSEATPEAPKISEVVEKTPKAPPPPRIEKNLSEDEMLYGTDSSGGMVGQYYGEYGGMVYSQQQQNDLYLHQHQQQHRYEEEQPPVPPPPPPHPHGLPLQPPPLPPDDDLAMLGICADDMAAQTF